MRAPPPAPVPGQWKAHQARLRRLCSDIRGGLDDFSSKYWLRASVAGRSARCSGSLVVFVCLRGCSGAPSGQPHFYNCVRPDRAIRRRSRQIGLERDALHGLAPIVRGQGQYGSSWRSCATRASRASRSRALRLLEEEMPRQEVKHESPSWWTADPSSELRQARGSVETGGRSRGRVA